MTSPLSPTAEECSAVPTVKESLTVRYADFLRGKVKLAQPSGLARVPKLSSALSPFQQQATEFCLRAGRAAMFLDTGLGKTRCQLEWARHIPGKVLILAPLAVAAQTVREAKEALGMEIHHSRDGSIGEGVTIANYERLHLFDASVFAGVVLDESGILKSFMGKTMQLLCETFANTPFRLACTATPAPNDYEELGNHSAFLGVMSRGEMLQRWFIHDSANTSEWKIKGHAERPFWQWVASWAACASRPSDFGFSDEGYSLPPLKTHLHSVATDYTIGAGDGDLFRVPSMSAANIHAEKRLTAADRVRHVAALVAAEPSEPWIVWCESNEESAALAKAIPECVEVKGADSMESKEAKIEAFTTGEARVIVSKSSICGFGLNWQHCARVAFASLSYSYEQFYQAIRRSWRFGQLRPVDVHVVIAETEMPIWQAQQSKLRAHEQMKGAMRHAVMAHGKSSQVKHSYEPTHFDLAPSWL